MWLKRRPGNLRGQRVASTPLQRPLRKTSRPFFVFASHVNGTSSPLAWKGFPCQKINLNGGDVGYLFFSTEDEGTKKLPSPSSNSGCSNMIFEVCDHLSPLRL
jgi:hypothetical protein